MTKDRLFVNLTFDSFDDFVKRGKEYEVRAYGRGGFNEKNVYPGKRVELKRAWNRGEVWGHVGKVYRGSLEDIFKKVPYKKVEPRATSPSDAIRENQELLKNPAEYLVFQVLLDSTKS